MTRDVINRIRGDDTVKTVFLIGASARQVSYTSIHSLLFESQGEMRDYVRITEKFLELKSGKYITRVS